MHKLSDKAIHVAVEHLKKFYPTVVEKDFDTIDSAYLMDQFVKQNTTDRFGPVRQVKPELVFEIAFEGIAASSRHKSGVAVRFPRILRWRHDKKMKEANSLEDLKKLLP